MTIDKQKMDGFDAKANLSGASVSGEYYPKGNSNHSGFLIYSVNENIFTITSTVSTLECDGNHCESSCNTTFDNCTDSGEGDVRDEQLAKFEVGLLATILFFAIFGNLIVLIVLRMRKRKFSRMQCLIVHLALADLFVAFFNVLPQMIWDITYRFYPDNFLCKFVKYMQVVAMYVSSYVLVMTAIDRYGSICRPLTSHTWTTKRVHVMVAIAWGLSLAFSIPQLTIFSYSELPNKPGVYDCWGFFTPWSIKVYVVWCFMSIYFIPFCILTLIYSRICYAVWMSMGSKQQSVKLMSRRSARPPVKISTSVWQEPSVTSYDNNVDNNTTKALNEKKPKPLKSRFSKAKVKTIKMTLTVIICYLVSWAPFFISMMWSTFDRNAPNNGKY